MAKKLKKIYLRKGEHPFVLQSLFIYKAKQQNWKDEEIHNVISRTFYKNRIEVYKILMTYVEYRPK
ncbi:hypothetical protein SKM57_12310 [Acinetobacter faecalis]|uniref:hypothetical protein n=1 Tax=Acinetobacter faecalis TaxID=2665161 RepID=UPI002A91FFF1|nr:hypothetical protein [Acinetobacter faecalis]MDY6458066.1 hypothetical protein [Acinetobacter faecalis]MDY6469361.1 hypothetical protein [Acinetobacter faecalis]